MRLRLQLVGRGKDEKPTIISGLRCRPKRFVNFHNGLPVYQTTLSKINHELEKASSIVSGTLSESDAGSALSSSATAIDESSVLELSNLELLTALFVIAFVVLVSMWYWENLLDWLERKWRKRDRVQPDSFHVDDEKEGASARLASLPIPVFKVADQTPQSIATEVATAERTPRVDTGRFTDQAQNEAASTAVGGESRTSDVGSDSSDLSNALMRSQQDLQDACQHIVELQFQLDSRNESLERLESESLSYAQTVSDFEQQINDLSCDHGNSIRRRQIEFDERCETLEATTKELETSLKTSQDESAKLRSELEDARKNEARLESIESQLVDAHVQRDQAQVQFDSVTSQHAADLEKLLTLADDLKEQLAASNLELESSRSDVEKLTEERSSFEGKAERVVELELQLESVTDELKTSQAQIDSLTSQHSIDLEKSSALADQWKTQLMTVSFELESSRSEVYKLTVQRDGLEHFAQRVVELETSLGSITDDLNVSQAQVDSLINQHAVELAKSSTLANELKEQLRVANLALESSRSEVAQLTRQRDGLEHFAQRVVELETQLGSVTDDLNASHAQVDSLTNQRTAELAKSSALADELKEQLTAADVELKSSKSEIEKLTVERVELEDKGQRVLELEAQLDSITNDLKAACAQVDSLTGQHAAELEKISALADGLKEQLSVATVELKASRSEIAKLMIQRSSLKQSADERVEKLRVELAQSTDRLDQALAQVDGLNAQKDGLKTALDRQAERLGLADAARTGAIKKTDVLQEQLDASDKQLGALRKELAQGAELLETELANVNHLEDALREQQSKNRAQTDTIAELETDLANASTGNADQENLQAQASDFQAIVGELQGAIDELKLELQQEKKRSAEAHETIASSESQIAMLRAEVAAASINRSNYKSLAQKMVGYKSKFRESQANIDRLVEKNKHIKALATEYLQNVNDVKEEMVSQAETIENLKQRLQEYNEQDDGSFVVTGGQELVNIHRSDVGNLVEKRARKYVLELKSHFEARIKRKNALIRKLKKEVEKTSSNDLEIPSSQTNWEDHQQVNIPR